MARVFKINGERFTLMDEITYKGHTIQKFHQFGGYTVYATDKKQTFGTMKDAKDFIRSIESTSVGGNATK